MAAYIKSEQYVPGTYVKKRPSASELAELYIMEWDKKRLEMGKRDKWEGTIPPTICFSRKIGVGTLEVGDLLAEKSRYQVIDREILAYIAENSKLSEKTVAIFDERYPGKLSEFMLLAFGEKSFIQSDYSRQLFKAIFAIAGASPTIFVGRGAHFLLPRDRVLAVRFIASKDHRIERLVKILDITPKDANRQLDKLDKEQAAFFKKVYGKCRIEPDDFDLLINLDYLIGAQGAAEIVALTFKQKFGFDIENV
jgi:cytidylate kinase